MLNYLDSSRWIVLQYRPGTGGKFLCAALMTVEQIAHWDHRVEHNEITFQDWVNEQWTHCNENHWIAYEPLHQWDIRFFSRTWPRGENLTLNDYQSLMSTSSDYFKELWQTDKFILDFLNKPCVPVWWNDAYIVRLDATPGCKIHRQFLLSKIYPYSKDIKKGMYMMDHPLPENPSPNARVYNNPYEFGPYNSEEEWYDYIWNNDFRLNFNMMPADVLLNDLLDFDCVDQFISTVANKLKSTYSKSNLEYLWNYWIEKHKNILKIIDTRV